MDVPEGAGTEGRLDTDLRLMPAGQQCLRPRDVAACAGSGRTDRRCGEGGVDAAL